MTVTRVQSDTLGLTGWEQYDSTDLGSGFSASTQPLQRKPDCLTRRSPASPGSGSRHDRRSHLQLARDGSVSPAGNNWSLSISGLTPFGLPLDIHPNAADTAAGRNDALDRLHRPKRRVHALHARLGRQLLRRPGRRASLPATRSARGYAADRARTAPPTTTTPPATRPRWSTRTETRSASPRRSVLQGRHLRPDRSRSPRSPTPAAAPTRSPTSTQSSTSRPNLWGKVSYVSDHIGHKWVFAYYDDGNLMSVTEQGGTNADGSYPRRSLGDLQLHDPGRHRPCDHDLSTGARTRIRTVRSPPGSTR